VNKSKKLIIIGLIGILFASSNLLSDASALEYGVSEGQWVKYKVTGLDIQTSDPIEKEKIKQQILKLSPEAVRLSEKFELLDFIQISIADVNNVDKINFLTRTLHGDESASFNIEHPQLFPAPFHWVIPIDSRIGDTIPVYDDIMQLQVVDTSKILLKSKTRDVFVIKGSKDLVAEFQNLTYEIEIMYDMRTGIMLKASAGFVTEELTKITALQFRVSEMSSQQVSDISQNIPDWVRSTANLWDRENMDVQVFAYSIQFLIMTEVINSSTDLSMDLGSGEIPSWVKINGRWWADGLIDDTTFIKGIEFLVNQGIIKV